MDLADALRQHFGFDGFRPAQEPIVRAALDGVDLLAVMPTGSGKSLCFQFPAVTLPGVTLVVSPLISLIKDQVDELTRRGIAAAAIHSLVPAADRRAILQGARDGAWKLLYVAPERFASDHFQAILAELRVARFVVDEAHCVSDWGHDFRPDYRRLAAAAACCRRSDDKPGRPPLLAFTATATPEVRDDITSMLGLERPRVFVSGFDRPNIELHVQPVAGDQEKHLLLPALIGDKRALVYASTRRNAEDAAATLAARAIPAAAYHAGLADAERTRVQNAFASGELQVVCATNAFGMGIDRPDIAAVVHVDVTGSIEAYYQEIGRAGRDGRRAVATLLWNYADVKTREFLIDKGRDDDADRRGAPADPAEIERRRELDRLKLRRMVAYADGAACLRATILRYFGDPDAREPCEACGNCLRRAPLDAAQLVVVRKILSGIARGGERYGKRKIVAMLVGDTDELPAPLQSLSTTGILRSEAPRTVERWIDAAIGAALVVPSNDQYRTLSLSRLGRDVMAGRTSDVRLLVPGTPPIKVRKKRLGRLRAAVAAVVEELRPGARPADPTLVGALRDWRREEAARRGLPAFTILHDRTIEALASAKPADRASLAELHGIGPAKLDLYGDALLKIINGDARG